MRSSLVRNVAVAVIGLILIGGVWVALQARQPAVPPAAEPGATSTPEMPADPDASAGTTRVKVALLDFSGETSPGKERGCDRVVLVERAVATTSAPLTAALRELFAIPDTTVDGFGNFMPRTRTTLAFDRATVRDGVARIYLTGSLSGLAGVCDDPRAAIQIEETALQFPTVRQVELYLDGERTTLMPDERGL